MPSGSGCSFYSEIVKKLVAKVVVNAALKMLKVEDMIVFGIEVPTFDIMGL